MFYQVGLVVHVIITIVLVLVVLVQTGKGADIGAVFGGGGAVFGGVGATTLLHKITIGLAAAFMTSSLVLSIIAPTSKDTVFKPIAETAAPVTSPLAPADASEVETTVPATEAVETPTASNVEEVVPATEEAAPAKSETPEH